MLRKKTNGYTRRSGRAPIVVNNGKNTIDRRGFLRGSGLAIGGLTAIAATGGSVSKATAQTAATRAVETVKSTHCSVAVRLSPKSTTASGQGRSPVGTARSTSGHIVPKGLLFVNTPMANAA